jgi:2-dehydro-3-deoxyphosphogluconate aldolase/(4S)-4-hydroxy-2-oxoglutarate aldolase
MVKLFPAPADVADYIKSILGPMPELKIFPTNGVTEENFAAVMRAGAAGVGFVRALFDPEAMARRDYKGIERRARRLIGLLEEFAPTPAGRI